MEILKKERDQNPYKGKKYGIMSVLKYIENNEPIPNIEPKIEEITIESKEDFMKISINIGKDNQKSMQLAKDFKNSFYTEKRLVLL